MKLNSVKNPFEILKRSFHPCVELLLKLPEHWENVHGRCRYARPPWVKNMLRFNWWYLSNQEAKWESVKYPVENLKRSFQPYVDLLLKFPEQWEKTDWSWRARDALFDRLVVKWTYLANQETKWNSVKYPFELTERPFRWAMIDPLKHLVEPVASIQSSLCTRPRCVKTCATSNEYISQTRKRNENP